MLRHKRSQRTKLCHDKGFVCRDIAGEVLEEECHDIPSFVTTLIKANGNGTLSQHFTTQSQHKELKMAKKLCHDKILLCRDTKFRVGIERQEDFVATEKFYVAIEKFYVATNTT